MATTTKKKTRKARSKYDANRKTPVGAEKLRAAVAAKMKALDHSIDATATGSGLLRSTLSRWLSGTRDLSTSRLGKVLDYLDITIKP